MEEEKKIKKLIAKGELGLALDSLMSFCDNTAFEDEAVLLSGRYSRLQTSKAKDILSNSELVLEQNKISALVLELAKRRANGENSKRSAISKVQLIIEGQKEEFGHEKRIQLKRILSAVLDLSENEIKILSVLAGSVKVVLELPAEKKELLIYLFDAGSDKLQDFHRSFNLLEVTNLEGKGKIDDSEGKFLKIKKFRGLILVGVLILSLFIILFIGKTVFFDRQTSTHNFLEASHKDVEERVKEYLLLVMEDRHNDLGDYLTDPMNRYHEDSTISLRDVRRIQEKYASLHINRKNNIQDGSFDSTPDEKGQLIITFRNNVEFTQNFGKKETCKLNVKTTMIMNSDGKFSWIKESEQKGECE